MPDLRKTRHQLRIATGALLLVDVIAIGLLLTPWAGRESLRQQELRQLRASLKSREAAPWRGLDRKIPQAKQDVATFYQDRFPSGYSAISTDLDRIASESGARISSEKYTQAATNFNDLQQVEIDADVSGDYLQLVKFINTVERNKLFFVIQSLELGGEQTGTVKLRMKLQTFLRTT
jgi:hypothetical protein